MKKKQIQILVIVGVIVIVFFIFIATANAVNTYNPNEVLAKSADGTIIITNKDYDTDSATASKILNELNMITSAVSKSAWGNVLDFITKYPQLSIYAYKYFGLSSANKQAVFTKGVGFAQTKDINTRKTIAQQAVNKKEPLWISIIDTTFQGV